MLGPLLFVAFAGVGVVWAVLAAVPAAKSEPWKPCLMKGAAAPVKGF